MQSQTMPKSIESKVEDLKFDRALCLRISGVFSVVAGGLYTLPLNTDKPALIFGAVALCFFGISLYKSHQSRQAQQQWQNALQDAAVDNQLTIT